MRGLKFVEKLLVVTKQHVALLVSAWIEIISDLCNSGKLLVALLVSAWIEINPL